MADWNGDGVVTASQKLPDGEMFYAVIHCDILSDYLMFDSPDFPMGPFMCYHFDLNLDGLVDLADAEILNACDGYDV